VLLSDELTELQHSACRLVRVASGVEGRALKAHVAAQLAWLLAEARPQRVLLVEADLDRPTLHEVLDVNVPRSFGLSEQLERMQNSGRSKSPMATRIRLGNCLDALLESAWGSASLFDSPQLGALLERERVDHDFIVINGPVVGDWPDTRALPLPGAADSVVYVTPQLSEADRDTLMNGAVANFLGAAQLHVIQSELSDGRATNLA
jgi:Mrp family chromosome partitioning ATPase